MRSDGWLARVFPPVVLLALNLAICWRVFRFDFADHFSSIEGAFIGIARYASRHWGDFSWWPLWHCGMPYINTYVPLVHLTSAAVALLGHVSAARAYHAVTGAAYALGPVTLYWMATRLGAHRGPAFLSALCYSLFSPCGLLMPEMARDMGGLWYARRLQVMTVYGEGPHVAAMTLLPIAILALENALRRRNSRAIALAAASLAFVFLTNVPGTMATALAVFCWICAQPPGQVSRAWRYAAVSAVFGYALACHGVPPSSLATVTANSGSMHPGFSNSLRHGPVLLVLLLAGVAAAGALLARTRLPLAARFAVLYFALVAILAVPARFQSYELLPQVGRLHLEMEMGPCLLLGIAAWWLTTRLPKRVRPVGLLLLLPLVAVQFRHYRQFARGAIHGVELSSRSEYTSARWLDVNLSGKRVYVAGSTSFWLNAFTDTAQMGGCCDQNQTMEVLTYVPGFINSALSPSDTRLSVAYMQALGVQAIVVNSKSSTDEYKDIQDGERFGALLPVLHRENGDTIYAVQSEPTSPAHVIRPEEQVPVNRSRHPLDDEVLHFASAVTDSSRAAACDWANGSNAHIRAFLRPGDLVSVQLAWFPGWHAMVNGRQQPVRADGLGLMVIQPDCQGNCQIALQWTGPRDGWFTAVISAGALLLAGFLILRPAKALPYNNGTTMIASQPEVLQRYQFKAGRYSSHTLLLGLFPDKGHGQRVLDLGCAAGYLSEALAGRGFSVACIDWPGTPHPATVEFSGADLDDGLGPVDGPFEYIICADVIEHLRDPLRILKECRARIAPGGLLVASLPNSAHWYFRWNVLMGRFPQHERGLFDSTHLHFYTWDGWVNLFARAGFRVESVRSSAVPIGLALPSMEGSWFVRAMERLSVECAKVWKTLFAYQFIVTARAREDAST